MTVCLVHGFNGCSPPTPTRLSIRLEDFGVSSHVSDDDCVRDTTRPCPSKARSVEVAVGLETIERHLNAGLDEVWVALGGVLELGTGVEIVVVTLPREPSVVRGHGQLVSEALEFGGDRAARLRGPVARPVVRDERFQRRIERSLLPRRDRRCDDRRIERDERGEVVLALGRLGGRRSVQALDASQSRYDDPMRSVLLLVASVTLGACASDDAVTPPIADASALDAVTSDATQDVTTTDAPVDVAPVDPCGGALFCETFESYPTVKTIADTQKFGPWHAALKTGATMALDGTHVTSGANALHVHIDNTVTAGGRLFADGAQPIFASSPTHLYGRMKMYIDPNGTSIHWTFFGLNGPADPSSPAAGRNASYILSSLPKAGVNTYSFVYGLSAKAPDGYHDCSSQSATQMPTAAWSCVSFEIDSITRKLRMYKDTNTTPILSVDDHGNGCVAPTVFTDPWYGPVVSQLFVGAWSFHAMNAPLDVWVDDVVVDTKPVTCPSK